MPGCKHLFCLFMILRECQVLQLVARLCKSIGYKVDTTRDPREAESMLRKSPNSFDVLVTDLTMPIMTGVQLAERVHSVAPHVRVLLMTGDKHSVEAQDLVNASVDSVITKPFDHAELTRQIEELVAR